MPLFLLLFVFACSRIPTLAEAYMHYCYPVIATTLSFVTRWAPFSLLDALMIAAIVLLLGSVVMMCMRRLSFRCWIKVFLLSVLWIAVWFYMAWGISYFRPGFHERFGVEQPKEDRDYFEALVVRYIDSLNHAASPSPRPPQRGGSPCAVNDSLKSPRSSCETLHSPLLWRGVGGEVIWRGAGGEVMWRETGSDALRGEVIKEIDREIESLYAQHHERLRLPYPNGWRRTKKTLTEPLMTRMGVAGYFDPFFNEVQVNNYALLITYPYTLAHEKAHQFGIAGEAECNLYATVICTSSAHPLVRYSGYLQTVSYLLGNLRKISPDRYQEITAQIDPRIKADYQAIREHWQKALNPTLSAMQDKVYDTYLKTNKQQSGILSYSEMVGLLVAWESLIH